MSPGANESLRIALLAPCWWPEVYRQSQRLTRNLAKGLHSRGHRTRLITSHRGRPSRANEDGLPILRLWRPPPRRGLENQGFEQYVSHLPGSAAALRLGNDDVAHAMYPTDAVAAASWTRAVGKPSVLTYIGMPDHERLLARRLRLEITCRAMGAVSATVVLSEAAAETLWRWLGIEARVIHPGVDLSAFSLGRGRHPEPTIICGNEAQGRRGMGVLMRAFALVRRERPTARLLVCRPDDPAVSTIGGPGVELLDPAGHAPLVDLYRSAWVSVGTSQREAFGLPFVEALACGTPIIAPRAGGTPEIVDRDGVGRLFDPLDEAALAHALLEGLELATDPATAEACRSRAETFSSDRAAKEYLDLYRGLGAG